MSEPPVRAEEVLSHVVVMLQCLLKAGCISLVCNGKKVGPSPAPGKWFAQHSCYMVIYREVASGLPKNC